VTFERPIRARGSVLDRLLRLDCSVRPGLSEPEFNRLFAKCNCGLIVTRRAFRKHVCAVAPALVGNGPPAVIDLTADDDDDDDVTIRNPSGIIIDLTGDLEEA
jgi:hypothetical protein